MKMASLRRPEKKKAETVTALWADGAVSVNLPEDATLADLAEIVEMHAQGRPLYVGVTFASASPSGNA
jgi:hypothetical protein